MSNSIWKSPDEIPAWCFLCVFDRPMGRSVGHYNPVKKQFCSGKLRFEYKDIDKFCMIDDLIAQADKAERLQARVAWLKHNINAWEKVSELKEEYIQRLQKAVDLALGWLEKVATPEKCDDDLCREFTKRKIDEIKQLIKGE